MLEPRSDHPAGGGTIPVVAGVEIELEARGEVVSVVDQGIPPPAVAVPKERPWIADSQRPLCIAAHAQLEAPGLIRLDVDGSANSLPLKEVAIIALQQEG